jgi:hypothetical protein
MLTSVGKTTVFQACLSRLEWKPLQSTQVGFREQSSLIQEGYRHKWIQLTCPESLEPEFQSQGLRKGMEA